MINKSRNETPKKKVCLTLELKNEKIIIRLSKETHLSFKNLQFGFTFGEG